MSNERNIDVIVIGGGPAGSTCSALLAEKGRRVVVFEKEKFPRYHIGESLMPLTYFPLKRLGLIDKMKASHFTKKFSVQFVRQDGRASLPFYFFQHLKHESAVTWQVVRAEFDQMLLENARSKGAEIHEETPVKEVIWENNRVVGVKVEQNGNLKEYRAPVTIDCSGREALTSSRNGWRKYDPKLNKIAIWTYYTGAKRDPGLDEGATTVAYIPHKGWFWYIPLPEDVLSVGVVADKDYLYRDTKDLEKIFDREVLTNKWIEEHLAQGQRLERFFTTGEYSYRSKFTCADGLVMAGDAFGFLDPVFSSGVLLALRSGELVADAVDAALKDNDVTAARFTPYCENVCTGIESMRKLVYAFYDEGFRFRALFDKYPDARGQVTDCLIGDLFREMDPLYNAVAEFAKLPPTLDHGRPLPSGTPPKSAEPAST